MLKLLSLFLLATIALSSAEAAKTVTKIEDCPPLSPRNPPESVHDLRPDDIKVIGALGDSIATGYAMVNLETVKEHRGLNFFIGGDEGAPTVPNYIKHYQPNLTGYSLGSHLPKMCDATTCERPQLDEISLDNLNVAQSGASVAQLSDQVGYLVEKMQSLKNVDFKNDWKMITLQIGTNSMCRFCAFDKVGQPTTPEKYGKYIGETLDLIQAKIPKVIVNLLDNFNTTQIFESSAATFDSYCTGAVNQVAVCPCSATENGFKTMVELYSDYNKILNEIYQKYQQKENRNDDFAVVYQQINMDFSSCPKEFFSNFDCLHASPVGHELLSKALWNQLFKPQADKPKATRFRYNETVYCPSDTDRLVTY